MKRSLIQDELAFPVYFLALPNFQGTVVDIPQELVEDYEKSLQEFMRVQEELGRIFTRGAPV